MKNASIGKREKILLSLMLLAVLWGAWEVFFAGTPEIAHDNLQTDVHDASQAAGIISRELAENRIEPHQEYVLELAARAWEKDPFYPLKQALNHEIRAEDREDESLKYRYTGFLEVGKKKMAIINGLEYQPGDEIEPGGAVVQNISPRQVEIRFTATGNTRILPYVD